MSDNNMQMTMETESVQDSGNMNNGDSDGDTATGTLQNVNKQNGHTTATERQRKRRRQNTGSVELANFEALNRDEQNSAIFAKLIVCEQTQNRLERLEPVVFNNTERVYTAEINIDANARKLKMLAYKQLDIETKLRKNNLIFRGLNENADVYSSIDQFFERLSINPEEVGVAEGYRLGGYRHAHDRAARAGNEVRRPILVSFRYPSDAERVLSRAYMLKGTRYSIDRDYPTEIAAARRRIWPDFKRIRSDNPKSKVILKYPARVEVDGNTVLEMFPEWVELMQERSSCTFDLTVPKPNSVEYMRGRPVYNPQYNASPGRSNESLSQAYIIDTESDSDSASALQHTISSSDKGNSSRSHSVKHKVYSACKQTTVAKTSKQIDIKDPKQTKSNGSKDNSTDGRRQQQQQQQQQSDIDTQPKNVNIDTRGDSRTTSSVKTSPIANESPGAQSVAQDSA